MKGTGSGFIDRTAGARPGQRAPALYVVRTLFAGVLGLTLGSVGGTEEEGFPSFQIAEARGYLQAVAQRVEDRLGGVSGIDYSLARLRSQLGEKDAAERLARRALERGPDRADIHLFLADLFIRQDRMEEAARSLSRAVELDPSVPGGWRRLGMVLDRLGDRPKAGAAFETAIRTAPDDATARLLLGRWLLDQSRVEEAAGHLRKACQLDPKLSGAFYALAQAQTRLNDAESAQASMKTFEDLKRQELAALDARNVGYEDEKFMRALAAGFHTEVAGVLVRQGQPALAEAQLLQAVRIAPDEPAAQELRTALLMQQGRVAEAREACETLVRLRPAQATYRVNLGTLLLQLNERSRAVEEWQRAVELDPRNSEGLHNLARFYLGARRDLPAALDLSRRLVTIQPTAASYDLLGWALYANGQTNEARAAAAQAVEREPTNTVYRERYRRLAPSP